MANTEPPRGWPAGRRIATHEQLAELAFLA